MKTVSKKDITLGLQDLGLQAGNKVLVHSSLSSLGHVENGADTVIDALLETVGGGGTVLVPTLTGDETLSPSRPPEFDPVHTPCWTGIIPETFRQRKEAIRSLHPTHSAAAIGYEATILTNEHHLSITPCDEKSPYGKLSYYDDSYILLLGVGHEANTTFHFVEELSGVEYHMQKDFVAAKIILNNEIFYKHVLLHKYGTERNFKVMEPIFIEQGIQKQMRIGNAETRLIGVKDMVRITAQAIKANKLILCA